MAYFGGLGNFLYFHPIAKNRKTCFANFVWALVASENYPPPPQLCEIQITPLILCEILIAPTASFYDLKYVKIVSGEGEKYWSLDPG